MVVHPGSEVRISLGDGGRGRQAGDGISLRAGIVAILGDAVRAVQHSRVFQAADGEDVGRVAVEGSISVAQSWREAMIRGLIPFIVSQCFHLVVKLSQPYRVCLQ